MTDFDNQPLSGPLARFSAHSCADQAGLAPRHVRFEVRDQDVVCGHYVRNYHYPSTGATTFHPFMADGQWFALYSPHYTGTRLMSLPDCQDIGGEEVDSHGFCPDGFHVPAYRLHSWSVRRSHHLGAPCLPWVDRLHLPWWPESDAGLGHDTGSTLPCMAEQDVPPGYMFNRTLGDWTWCPFGLVSGCVWGDDSTSKVEFLDLSQASQGIVVRRALFGYAELPAQLLLRDAIDMAGWRPDGVCNRINLAINMSFDLVTGQRDSELCTNGEDAGNV